MFLSSSHVEWYMTSKGQVETLTSGQGHDLTQTYHDAYHSICLDKKTRQTCFEACILPQWKVIARKLLVTYDDVTRPPLLIAEVSGAPVNFSS